MNLRPEQQQAVTRTGQDVCVVAGPGSGKTRVLVERFAWLVLEKGTRPDRVLAFTFTEKAATEIKNRLVERFEKNPSVRERMERAWVSTMHGFCSRLLHEHAIAAGVDPQFVVLDEQQARDELASAVEAALDEFVLGDLEGFRVLADAVSTWDLASRLAGAYKASRASLEQPQEAPAGVSFEEFVAEVQTVLRLPLDGWSEKQKAALAEIRDWAASAAVLCTQPAGLEHFQLMNAFKVSLASLKSGHTVRVELKRLRDEAVERARGSLALEYFAPQRRKLLELLKRIDEIYTANKRAHSALDFDDLERGAIELLRGDPAVRSHVQGLFDAILMDELQDTNPLQWALVDLIRTSGQFFAVGDINQSIYGFRHAEPRVFSRFQEEIESKGQIVDRLRENHRSRKEILEAVEAIVGTQSGIRPPQFVPKREFGPKAEPSVEVLVVKAEKEQGKEQAAVREARWIARRIRELESASGVKYKDVAILVRKTKLMPPLEDALKEFGIPCLVSRGNSFFEALEVTDLVRWLRVVENPRDEISMAAVLRSPLVGVSDETLFRMKQNGNLADALDDRKTLSLDPEESLKLERFARQLDEVRPLAGYVSPDRLIARAMDDCDYEGGLDARGRSNVEKLLNLIRDLWAADPSANILDSLEAYRGAARESEAPPDDTTNAVRIMSIHAAKGLQFPVVLLASLQAGVNQNQDDICYSNEFGLGVRWRVPGSLDAVPDPIHERISAACREREKQEADRLLFVAMTRAEGHLALSFVHSKRALCNWGALITNAFGFDPEQTDVEPIVFKAVRLFRTGCDAPGMDAGDVEQKIDPAVLLDKPPRAGQYDSTSSVTALIQFRECPRQYFLGRYLGWRAAAPLLVEPDEEPADDGRDEIGGSELGTAVHAWLAGQRSENADPAVVELASRFERSELGQRAARASRAGRESDFIFALDELILRGQIDLWFEEDGELVLIDYKTDRFDAETRAERLENYSLQLRYYAAALSRILGKKVDSAYLYLLREDRAEPVQLGDEDDLVSLIRSFRAAQEELNFPIREGGRCRHCDFYRGCSEPVQFTR